MQKIYKTLIGLLAAGAIFTSCSKEYMQGLNTDTSKVESLDPNMQLTTALLQTYGDFSLMDTYRSYITGFTQHFAGGWNVTNYAGSVYAFDDQMRLLWDRYYSVSIKNLADGIANSTDKPNLNAALRIHYVYLMSVLTDVYGDVPCLEAGKGYLEGISTPKYDTQEEIYNFFFEELKACVAQLGTGEDRLTGDVTSLGGDIEAWKRYANSLRMRFAMRISDVNPQKAQQEFEDALIAAGGYIATPSQDAYVVYIDGPFTLYEGANELDFRVNALGEILYGQDPTSPTFVSSTFYNMMKDNNDPRLYRICRHYINTKRSETKPDAEWNVDVTDEVLAYYERIGDEVQPCNPGAAWYSDWVNAPADSEIPTLEKLVAQDPTAGFNGNNFNARMLRPFLSIDFEMPNRPGFLMSSAEVHFLMAEAADKGWTVTGTVEDHFKAGIADAMQIINKHYVAEERKITDAEVSTYADAMAAGLATNAKEAINTQAWLLHFMNPSEAWANLRRSDYPVVMDRTKLKTYDGFIYDDPDMSTPTRLKYPVLESKYNTANYNDAIQRLGGKDDWHARLWWDTADINVK